MRKKVYVCPACFHMIDYYNTEEWVLESGYLNIAGDYYTDNIIDSADLIITCPECEEDIATWDAENSWIEYDDLTMEIIELGDYWVCTKHDFPEDFETMLDVTGLKYVSSEEPEKPVWRAEDIFIKEKEVWKV